MEATGEMVTVKLVMGKSYATHSVVRRGLAGDGKGALLDFTEDVPMRVDAADAEHLLAIRIPVKLAGGIRTSVPKFEKVDPAAAFQQLSAEERIAALLAKQEEDRAVLEALQAEVMAQRGGLAATGAPFAAVAAVIEETTLAPAAQLPLADEQPPEAEEPGDIEQAMPPKRGPGRPRSSQ